MNNPNSAAFFDIDGTIYREGLITEVFKKLVTHEIIEQRRWHDEVKPAYMAWDRRQGDYDTYLSRMVDIFKEVTRGISREHIDLIATRVIEQKGERVYTFTRDEILRHKREGRKIIAVSGSPDALVEKMAHKYGFDDWRGTVYHVNEKGVYTGENTPMWDSVSKRNAILKLCDIYRLQLEDCYAYGDTNGDYAMLSMVGHPTAVNPTRELLHNIQSDEALKRKMQIVVERKDVIYRMNMDAISI